MPSFFYSVGHKNEFTRGKVERRFAAVGLFFLFLSLSTTFKSSVDRVFDRIKKINPSKVAFKVKDCYER